MDFIDKVHCVCESVIRDRRQHHESSVIVNQVAVYTFSSDPLISHVLPIEDCSC